MSYGSEFRLHWRALTAASLGLAIGYTFNNYVTNVVSPHLIRELGWSRADFALLGLIVIVAVICQPIAGRLTDAIGVRRMATIGVVAAPILFLVLSRMPGDFAFFYVVNLLQVLFVGGTTSVVIYTRLIAERFDMARGIALGIAACAPALAGAICAPLLAGFVEAHGWRAGYVVAAVVSAVVGLVALLLIPASTTRREAEAPQPEAPPVERSPVSYRAIARNPAFPLLIAGMLLCNLTLTMQMSQVNILLIDRGVDTGIASLMISLYAIGVIIGRLGCGAALDHFPPHIVAAITMAAPAIGLFMLASGLTAPLMLGLAVAILGLATGAEGDVGGYLVMRYFKPQVYSSVFGIVMGALAASGAIGALLLSSTLAMTGTFTLFLWISGIAALIGGLLFLLLASKPAAAQAPPGG